MEYSLKRLLKNTSGVTAWINGKWVPARPMSPTGLFGLKVRIKSAWKVLTGKADIFIWPEGQ